ncbi:4Fe-4S binding protein [Candidatus Micrarchaeota archaeon]|nr:4Fe-4S binding protein [Candidatus Micrarchaeota archaeon]
MSEIEKFRLDERKCIYCGGCVSVCPVLAITLEETRIICDQKKCTRCRACEKVCPLKAITII